MAGKEPGPAPADAIAARSAIAAELDLIGSADIAAFLRESEASIIRDAAMRLDVLPSVVLYCGLVCARLVMLTEDEPYDSAASMTAKRSAALLVNLTKRSHYVPNAERAARAVRAAVGLADLHLSHERQQATIESTRGCEGSGALVANSTNRKAAICRENRT